ncbi:lysine N(6)-hydroxylase/L-ornithine N(5)-oxygenase family protein [Streptomyces flavidovirens]|uniref:L-lysine N6-monooxygenase MbtG n=1 Tax=Streptomyces flavidovirens TaxID=67298 RepID=A0ABW6RIU9_9ACTN
MDETVYDYVAVGVGPANLSLAAQAYQWDTVCGLHLERKESFSWHPGLLLPEATLQISPLKDLVTPVDPTSPFSFLAFLADQDRLYEFLTADFPAVHRTEFNQYLTWVSERLPSLRFGAEVREVSFRDGAFVIRTDGAQTRSRHLVLGTGLTPRVDDRFRTHLGPTAFHAGEFLTRGPQTAGRQVAVVGGGQSGAEIVRHLMTRPDPPRGITWISRRPSYLPLDDSPFTNEFFFPDRARAFHRLAPEHRARLLREQKYASDGIDLPTLEEIYRRRYVAERIEGRTDWLTLLPACEMTELAGEQGHWKLTVEGADPADSQVLDADLVVFATGYGYELPAFMTPLASRLSRTGGLLDVHDDFRVGWDGPDANRIYLQNGARHAWGIADPNLSLLAWRSSLILHSILKDR